MNTSDWHLANRRAMGREISKLRTQKHLSQEQLAEAAGLDRSYMGRIERGEQSASLDKILDICKALSVNPSNLFKAMETNSEQ